MPDTMLTEPIAEQVWRSKYRLRQNGHATEPNLHASRSRVALALSNVEAHDRNDWRMRFESILAHHRFLPGGRILAGAGSGRHVTLMNCFVAGAMHDAIDSIFGNLAETMLTMQAGGGVGIDFSCLRPAGQPAVGSGNIASGPVSFMQVFDAACATLQSTGSRRGAMMATLRIDHPDIELFIHAKRDPQALRHFNLSVLVSDAFMQALEKNEEWMLVFPLAGRAAPQGALVLDRIWSHSITPEPCVVVRTVPARLLWEQLQRTACETGDPGVLFIDRIARSNNLWYDESISATNPCGEVPLPPHGACNLGSINLTQFVQDPFGAHAKLDLAGIAATTAVATRLLDNAIEAAQVPLKIQHKQLLAARRIGIGITGLADAFIMLGLRYGCDASMEVAAIAMKTICHAAYQTSIELVKERGLFPAYRPRQFEAGPFILSLPAALQDAIQHHGIHNSHLTAIAPAGSISLLANNISSGIEPVFAFNGHRTVRDEHGTAMSLPVTDYAWRLFRQRTSGAQASLPPYFVEAGEIDWLSQLKVQAALQQHVDQAIAKTINISPGADLSQFQDVFVQAYRLGLKGCTVFRASSARGAIVGDGPGR